MDIELPRDQVQRFAHAAAKLIPAKVVNPPDRFVRLRAQDGRVQVLAAGREILASFWLPGCLIRPEGSVLVDPIQIARMADLSFSEIFEIWDDNEDGQYRTRIRTGNADYTVLSHDPWTHRTTQYQGLLDQHPGHGTPDLELSPEEFRLGFGLTYAAADRKDERSGMRGVRIEGLGESVQWIGTDYRRYAVVSGTSGVPTNLSAILPIPFLNFCAETIAANPAPVRIYIPRQAQVLARVESQGFAAWSPEVSGKFPNIGAFSKTITIAADSPVAKVLDLMPLVAQVRATLTGAKTATVLVSWSRGFMEFETPVAQVRTGIDSDQSGSCLVKANDLLDAITNLKNQGLDVVQIGAHEQGLVLRSGAYSGFLARVTGEKAA